VKNPERPRTHRPILVTAALPYANGPIHLGHLSGAYLPADMYVRYQRLKKRDVLFICGSDEHGVPITISAEHEGVTPKVIVDRYHEMNKAAFDSFGMSFDNYSRTSLPLHHETSVEFFLDFHRRGILKEKKEQQFYDEKAEMFLPDRYVEGTCPVCSFTEARGDQCERCGSYLNPMDLINPRSKISGETPVVREAVHLYFPLGEYQSRLEAYVRERNTRDGWKENVLNYCKSWFNEGLQDRAVTRDLDWGVKIPLPGYTHKVLYVWFDAVLGYVSSTKEWAARIGRPEEWKNYWLNEQTKYVAFIGKDNVVFHCIVFPAMLMAWNDTHHPGYVLPENVPANEFLNFEGQKFSKSREWGIDVRDFLGTYPADPLRYYLAMALPEYRDSDFTWRDFQAKNNNELADILGNFVNRTLAFAARNFGGVVPKQGELTAVDTELLSALRNTPVAAGDRFEHYRFRDGVVEVMNLARAANKYFNDSEPWKTLTTAPDRCATTINLSVQTVRALAILIEPILPFSSRALWRMLGFDDPPVSRSWDEASALLAPAGQKLGTPKILFSKIEDATIDAELRKLREAQPGGTGGHIHANKESPPMVLPKAVVTIDDFGKIDLRVARVVQCEKVPKSEKLLKILVEVGTEKRQIVAGIAQHYQPEDLLDKTVVVVFNLQPAKLMGQESQGMLLAAADSDGRLVVVSPSGEVTSGSVVK
jgi:methionyl-tRNA synthetase